MVELTEDCDIRVDEVVVAMARGAMVVVEMVNMAEDCDIRVDEVVVGMGFEVVEMGAAGAKVVELEVVGMWVAELEVVVKATGHNFPSPNHHPSRCRWK